MIGASAGIAGIGYFLSVNEVDVPSLLAGTYEPPEKTVEVREIETVIENEVVKRVEVVESTTDSPVAAIAEKVIPSIVSVRITFPYTNYFFNMEREGSGEGSGIIVSEDGYIITNNHVIESALIDNSNELYESSTIKVFLYDDTENPLDAVVVGRDVITDLAVLKIEADNLTPIDIGDSDAINVGDLAVAIGNPGGMMYMGSVTSGIISGLNRELYDQSNGGNNGESLNLIQTDAAINPGNSGGALVNSRGELIGINTLKIVSEGYEGLGFAIPVNKAMEITNELRDQGYISRGRPNIGILISREYDAEAAEAAGTPEGALIAEVGALTPAETAGLKVNDIITAINGVRVKTYEELLAEKEKYIPGDEIIITVYRKSPDPNEAGGRYFDLPLILGEANY
jgi:serine protease Do